ncbi:hypothetical protein HQO27_20310 [Rhodococcus fascians]|uniref:hypothetical protein n=1 Tax=Nocardiaceae TaxID=85025 RepID=UPI00111471C1|nr:MULTISPECIES: hypothetical protein [Rhodococcus]MBY4213328.1 hypothetical protein [Rhodococcus fascians]MBY4238390.1 hypothetical protein [Rhodococcus fascians]MBY4254229.1 hypothetical protein [Rhodococcus fascians]MBY4269610.1 hypothetical protein [Rhodococcus fascians]MBY4275771.1 hypothetical protein [Rhodococcus fascians]
MGHDRNATPEKIEQGETTMSDTRIPDDAKDPARDEQPGPTNEADPHYGHEDWAPGPTGRWFTATELIDWGYKPEALRRLFGPHVEGPDEIQGWLIDHVQHIEETVIYRAVELLESTFQPDRLRKMIPAPPDADQDLSDAEVAAMVDALPPTVTATASN